MRALRKRRVAVYLLLGMCEPPFGNVSTGMERAAAAQWGYTTSIDKDNPLHGDRR